MRWTFYLCVVLWACKTASAQTFPLRVESCGTPVTFQRPPERAVFHDVNIAEMGFALHLQPFMRGLTGITGWNKESAAFQAMRGKIPELAPRYPSLEQLMEAHADLFVAGWNYGMRIGSDVTPETLSAQGIASLVLSESCFHAGGQPRPITLDALLYADERRLGAVFGRAAQADALIAGWTRRVAAVRARLAGVQPLRVFLYDSGEDAPFTAGRDALATELIRLGGGQNVFGGLPTNWGRASWEAAALSEPQAIIMVDYGTRTRSAWESLQHQPLMADTPAVRDRRVLFLRYDQVTPSPGDVEAIEAIAAFLHPERTR